MRKTIVALIFLISLKINISPTYGANILALFPSCSPSHLIIDMAVVNALAERQHNVTVITVLPLKSNMVHSNITHIQLKSGLANMELAIRASQNSKGPLAYVAMLKAVRILTTSVAEILDDEEFLNILHNPDNKFELMVFGYLFADYLFGVAAHFNCPIALIWPNQPMPYILNHIGNPYETSHVPNALLGTNAELNFKFRFFNIIGVVIEEVMMNILSSWMKGVYNSHFPADKYPSYEEAGKNVDLILYAHHFSEKPVRALVPGLIEIGGIQLNDKPNALPKDLAFFLDSAAAQGAIFFSLGTNVRKEHLEPDTLRKLFNVFSKLPQKVIWKCDDIDIPGNSSNILFKSWVPQADILAHPNVRLFFNHGGKGGITEALFNGVPMIGLPIFGDQPSNLEDVTNKGYGVSILNFRTMTEDDIEQAVKEVSENPRYRTEVQKFSKIYRDRPMSAKETAVYWLEYVIRHKGARHMQSPLKTLSLSEAYNVDVILVSLLLVIILVKITKTVVYFLRKILRRTQKTKIN